MGRMPIRSYLFDLGAPVDAKFQGTNTTPPIILLNFVYGVAAYKRWKSTPGVGTIKAYFAKCYETIPVPRPRAPGGEGSDYVPEDTTSMEEAMDELNMVLMYLRGKRLPSDGRSDLRRSRKLAEGK
jgi:hypothetical protein